MHKITSQLCNTLANTPLNLQSKKRRELVGVGAKNPSLYKRINCSKKIAHASRLSSEAHGDRKTVQRSIQATSPGASLNTCS